MTRLTYRAARREEAQEPVEFDFVYDERIEDRTEEGELRGYGYEERTDTFKCYGTVSTLLLSKLANNAEVDTGSEEGMRLIDEFFVQAFGDSDEGVAEYRRFFRLQTKYGDDDLMMQIIAGLVEQFVGRPTQQRSRSESTPSSAGASSKVVSLSRGSVQVVSGEVVPTDSEETAASSG
jgi:hypothetical protein